MQSILIGDYKAVRTNVKNGDEPFEVYHTLKDPKETQNLAGRAEAPKHEDIMAAILRSRRANSSAKRPYDNQLVPALGPELKSLGKVRLKMIAEKFPWVPMTEGLEGETKLVKGLTVENGEGVQELSTYLLVPEDGEYQFSLIANGKAVVRLHDAVLIDADSHYSAGETADSGSIHLQQGVHPLKVIYQSAKGKPAMSLQWKTPSGSLENIPSELLGLLE